MLLLITVALTLAPESGPAAGIAVPALSVVRVQETLGEPENLVADRKDQPTLYAFVPKDKWDRPTARFLRELDQKLGDVTDAKLIFVWISPEETEASAEYMRRVQQSLKMERTIWSVVKGEAGDVKDWELNPEAHLTLVVAKAGKVTKSLGYRSVNETEVANVMKLLK